MERNYYMVRAVLSSEKDFDFLFDSNIVAIGWSDVNFTQYMSAKELREAVRNRYYLNSHRRAQTDSMNMNEVERFKNIKKGDYIIVPFFSGIALAVAESEELYSEEARGLDLANQRKAAYRFVDGKPLIIPRNELSEGLQRRLRVRGRTVSNLSDFKDEIEKIFASDSYSYSQTVQESESNALAELHAGLLRNIRGGQTNLPTGGIGLERLVCELMIAEGYDAHVLAKTKFSGKADADIEAIKIDAFMEKRIFVQVKHHSGVSPRDGIIQVLDVVNQSAYQDYEGYFITSADVSSEDLAFAKENGIEVMDGNALVDLIISDFSKLSETARQQLGICRYPTLLQF